MSENKNESYIERKKREEEEKKKKLKEIEKKENNKTINEDGTLASFDGIKAKEYSCTKKISVLATICHNLKTIIKTYGEEISHSKSGIPPVAFEIDRNLETPGRLIQSSDFHSMEIAFSDIMTSTDSVKTKVDRIFDTMNKFKSDILSGPLTDRRAKMCFLLYRASDYLRPFEEELELKEEECLVSMHHLRTQISFDLIEHSFLFVQNASPIFDVNVDRFKMLQHTSTQTFFYLNSTNTYSFIKSLHEAIDTKMKVIIDDYSPDMITPEEFVAFANSEGKAMKKTDEQQIEELEGKIQEMKDEAKTCMYKFSLEMTKEAISIVSDILQPDEAKLLEGVVFAGVDVVKKITDYCTGNKEEIEEKGATDIFQNLIKRQELLRKAHYSSIILRKMKGKSSELVNFLHMVRLYNLLTNRKLDKRKRKKKKKKRNVKKKKIS